MRMAATKQRILCQDYHGHVDCRQRPGHNGVSGSGLKLTWDFKMENNVTMKEMTQWHCNFEYCWSFSFGRRKYINEKTTYSARPPRQGTPASNG